MLVLTFADWLFEQREDLLDVPVHVDSDVVLAATAGSAQLGGECHPARTERDVHDVAKLVLERVVVVEELGDEREGDLAEAWVVGGVRWLSSSRLEMIFLKSFLLREAKISSWFFLLTTMWLSAPTRT